MKFVKTTFLELCFKQHPLACVTWVRKILFLDSEKKKTHLDKSDSKKAKTKQINNKKHKNTSKWWEKMLVGS